MSGSRQASRLSSWEPFGIQTGAQWWGIQTDKGGREILLSSRCQKQKGFDLVNLKAQETKKNSGEGGERVMILWPLTEPPP
jgi:hypothetical protein